MWLDRLNKIMDDSTLSKIRNKTVLIIGLGGVGGSSLESIVRMGVNNIIIVDNDVIDETNLNRQILSLKSNIGEYKTDVAKKRILASRIVEEAKENSSKEVSELVEKSKVDIESEPPIFAPSSSCVIPAALRSSLIRSPIVVISILHLLCVVRML